MYDYFNKFKTPSPEKSPKAPTLSRARPLPCYYRAVEHPAMAGVMLSSARSKCRALVLPQHARTYTSKLVTSTYIAMQTPSPSPSPPPPPPPFPPRLLLQGAEAQAWMARHMTAHHIISSCYIEKTWAGGEAAAYLVSATSSRKAASAASLQTRVNSAPTVGWQQGGEGEEEEEEEEEEKEEERG